MLNNDLKTLPTNSTIHLSNGQSGNVIFPILESQKQPGSERKWLEENRSDSQSIERWIAVDNIQPGKLQPRQYFDESAINALANDFRENGFRGILNVRPLDTGHYELVAGERRWRAAKKAGINKVLCLVSHFNDEEALQFSLIENIKRVNLSKLEETMAILQLIEVRYGLSQAQTAKIIRTEGHPDKRSRCDVVLSQELKNIETVLQSFDIELQTFRTRNLRSLSLPEELIQAHLKGEISWSVALELHKLKDVTLRQALLDEILDRESASFRWVQQKVKTLKTKTPKADAPGLVPLGKRLRAVAKQVNKVEAKLSTDQRQEIEIMLKALDELLQSPKD